MPRTLSSRTTPDSIRKAAKRWLKALEAGDPRAVARYAAAVARPSPKPKLREVQHALAREYGYPTWAALKQEIEDCARTHAERIALFLEKSVHRYGTDPATHTWGGYERDGDWRGEQAARVLSRHPEIARDSIHTAVVAGDIESVRGFLEKDPSLASRPGGIDRWTPLVRLAYTRLPTEAAQTNGVAIARLLLDAGADPKARWPAEKSAFTALTGAIGGGEAGQSPHPQAEELARLLIAWGADPLDGQALYNTSLGADDTLWLDLLWAASERRGETARWREEIPNALPPALDYLLGNAVPNQPLRTAWLLAHGADARAVNHYTKQPVVLHAALAGRQDLVDLLVAHGAEPPQLSPAQRFLAAATQGDMEALRRLARAHPEVLRDPEPMFAALRQDSIEVAESLLDLGMSPDVGDAMEFRALHYSTHCGAVRIAELLIARGAEVDAVERRYNSTPLGHANYQRRPEMAAVIAPASRDIRGLCHCGAVERLKELLAEDPSLASRPSRGALPLFCLPDDDERAAEVAELLLAHGADPSVKNEAGLTPAEEASRRGLEEAAAVITAAKPKT